ncbi:MAG: hypothetical protein ACRDLL_03340 [Solirubrobacterales bacterium]
MAETLPVPERYSGAIFVTGEHLQIRRRVVVLALVGVCALSAAVGSGVTLLAKTGPQGPPGPVGAEGPPGDSAEQASYEAEEAVNQVDELDERLSTVEWQRPSEEAASRSELERVKSDVRDLEAKTSGLCRGLELVC